MDPLFVSVLELLAKGVTSTVLIILLIYTVITLYKKLNEVQESRVKDSKERENTVTVALDAATHTIQSTGETLKTILITLEKQNGQSKTESKD
jgi:hypothetical protein